MAQRNNTTELTGLPINVSPCSDARKGADYRHPGMLKRVFLAVAQGALYAKHPGPCFSERRHIWSLIRYLG
jgi:hypothetical protein